VLLEVLLSGSGHLQADELQRQMIVSSEPDGKLHIYVRTNLVTPLLETRDDVTNESSLDTVGLKNRSFE
jgi:hypothetical protein